MRLFGLAHSMGQPHQLRERRRGLASGAAQLRDQAVERRLRMPVELAQIDLLELATAGAPDIEETVIRGECDADHRRPVGFVPPLHQPVPFGHGRGAERCVRGVVLARAARSSCSMSLSPGRMPMRALSARVDRAGKVLKGDPDQPWRSVGADNNRAARGGWGYPPPCRFNAEAVGLFRPKTASFCRVGKHWTRPLFGVTESR